jgi:hypothetical protein
MSSGASVNSGANWNECGSECVVMVIRVQDGDFYLVTRLVQTVYGSEPLSTYLRIVSTAPLVVVEDTFALAA